MTATLNHCPFCGAEGKILTDAEKEGLPIILGCSNDECLTAPQISTRSLPDGIHAWNTRVTSSEIPVGKLDAFALEEATHTARERQYIDDIPVMARKVIVSYLNALPKRESQPAGEIPALDENQLHLIMKQFCEREYNAISGNWNWGGICRSLIGVIRPYLRSPVREVVKLPTKESTYHANLKQDLAAMKASGLAFTDYLKRRQRDYMELLLSLIEGQSL